MSDTDIFAILYLVGFVLGLVVLFAQLRLFSIDRTLKLILAELKSRPNPAARSTTAS